MTTQKNSYPVRSGRIAVFVTGHILHKEGVVGDAAGVDVLVLAGDNAAKGDNFVNIRRDGAVSLDFTDGGELLQFRRFGRGGASVVQADLTWRGCGLCLPVGAGVCVAVSWLSFDALPAGHIGHGRIKDGCAITVAKRVDNHHTIDQK